MAPRALTGTSTSTIKVGGPVSASAQETAFQKGRPGLLERALGTYSLPVRSDDVQKLSDISPLSLSLFSLPLKAKMKL